MTFKKILKSFLVVGLFIGGLFFLNFNFVHAAIRFENFDLSKFSTTTEVSQELIDEIQAFAFRTLNELETCKGRNENQFQTSWCNNIYEADKIRLSYLLALNADFSSSIVTKNNHIRKLVFGQDNTQEAGGESDGFALSSSYQNSDLDKHLKNDLPFENFYPSGTQTRHQFGKATEQALKSCALNEGSYSRYRLKKLNPNLDFDEDDTELESFPEIGCNDLQLVIKQFLNESYIQTILENTSSLPPWLKFNQQEKLYFQLSADEKNKANSWSFSDDDYQDIPSQCFLRGLQAIIICPAIRTMGGLSEAGMNMIDKHFILHPKFTNQRSVGGQVLYHSWKNIRDIANLFLIIAVLIVVISYFISSQNSAYKLKTFLPRLIAIVILINVSFFLMQIAVDLSNIFGSGIYQMLTNITTRRVNILDITTQILAGGAALGGAALLIASGGGILLIALLIPVIIAVTISIVVIILLLSIRDAAFVIATLMMPIAIASLLLPNTSRLFDLWKKIIIAVLTIPISTGLLFGAGKLTSSLMLTSGSFLQLFTIVPIAVQFYLLPKIILNSIKNLPLVGNKIASTVSGLSGKVSEKYEKSEFNQQLRKNASRQFDSAVAQSGHKKGLRQAPYNIRLARAKALDRFVPNYSTLAQSSEFNPEEYKDITELSKGIDPVTAKEFLAGAGILQDSNEETAKLVESNLDNQSTDVINKVKSMSASDPSHIMANLLVASDDGEGNYMSVLNGVNKFIENGGNQQVAAEFLKTIKSNYQKEAMYSEAAALDQILKDYKKGTRPQLILKEDKNGKQVVAGFEKADHITQTVKFFENNTNWTKFKGFKAGSVDDLAFRNFISQPGGDKALRDVISASSQNQDAVKYLNNLQKSL